MKLSSTLKFIRIIFVVYTLLEQSNCDCGLPGIPNNAKIDSFNFVYSEDIQIEYYCELPELVLLNGKSRTCKNGRWTGSIPICVEEIGGNSIQTIEIADNSGKRENITVPIEYQTGKAFVGDPKSGQCVSSKSGSLKPVTYQIFLRKKYSHISNFEILIQTKNPYNSSDILLDSVMNSVRVCSVTVKEPAVPPLNLLRLKFVCDLVSNTDDETRYDYFSKDKIQNITLRFDSSSISLCEVRMFYRKLNRIHSCGSPDIPVRSTVDLIQYGSKYGSVPYYRYSCDKNFELIGTNEVRCGVNNYWLDEFPACVPKNTCPMPPPEHLADMLTIKYFYRDYFRFNGQDIAVPGTQVIYSCNLLNNFTKVMIGDSVRLCTKSGKWSGIQPYCMDLDELKMDKYSEIFETKLTNQTALEIKQKEEINDCGLPAIPMYAKPSPSRWMAPDFRSRYPNGTKLNFRCESAFHIMLSRTKTRKCINRKWKGNVGKCEVNHGSGFILVSIDVLQFSTKKLITDWNRPEPNVTETKPAKEYISLYEDNAFGNRGDRQCVSFNVTEKQVWNLKLNDTKPITSFFVNLKPGGIYGGFSSYAAKTNYSTKPIVAKVGRTICTVRNIYDSPNRTTHLSFSCDDEPGVSDQRSNYADQISLIVNPDLFHKNFDPQNVSLCSLTLFHSSENCGTPERPLNSFVRIENQIAYYFCEDGYELIGHNSVQCLPNGKWAQDFPICKLKLNLCSINEHSSGVMKQLTNTGQNGNVILGTIVTYNCVQPFPALVSRPVLIGSRIRICQPNGDWSGTEPICIDSIKFQTSGQSTTLSTKALVIIISVSISTVIVILLIALVIVCHLTQKCLQCCSFCWNGIIRLKKSTKSDENSNPVPIRPESKVNITEINETLQQLARFKPAKEESPSSQC